MFAPGANMGRWSGSEADQLEGEAHGELHFTGVAALAGDLPKVEDRQFVLGLPQSGWLGQLKISQRTVSLDPS